MARPACFRACVEPNRGEMWTVWRIGHSRIQSPAESINMVIFVGSVAIASRSPNSLRIRTNERTCGWRGSLLRSSRAIRTAVFGRFASRCNNAATTRPCDQVAVGSSACSSCFFMKDSSIDRASSLRPLKRIRAQSPSNIRRSAGLFRYVVFARGSPSDVRLSKSMFRRINGSTPRTGCDALGTLRFASITAANHCKRAASISLLFNKARRGAASGKSR